jgi:hypothetical protein
VRSHARHTSANKRAVALADLAVDVHRYVADGDTGPHRDAFTSGQFDRGATMRASAPADLGNVNHPPIRVASDFDVEALADRRACNAGSESLGSLDDATAKAQL